MQQLSDDDDHKDKGIDKFPEISNHKIINNTENKIESDFVANNGIKGINISDGLSNCVGIERSLLSRIASTASACESQISAIPVVYSIDGTDANDVKFSLTDQIDSDNSTDIGSTSVDHKNNKDELIISEKKPIVVNDNIKKNEATVTANKRVKRRELDSPEEVDFVLTDEWKNKEKHVFIFSQAGKPIYSRYGQEDRLVTLTGIMQALISVGETRHDRLQTINAGDHRVVFLSRGHVCIVGASRCVDSEAQVFEQLKQVHGQLLSVMTSSQIDRMFRDRTNYDLRNMLAGTEKFFDSLLTSLDSDVGFLLNSVKHFPLPSTIRDSISNIIVSNAKVKDLLYIIYVCRGQLICKVAMKDYSLHSRDLGLVVNLVQGSESFKSSETWTPLCLPHFDSKGYLHAHISYMEEECNTCLLLLTVNRDSFFDLSTCKHSIQKKLQQNSHLAHISKHLKLGPAHLFCPVPIDLQPSCRHFVYKMAALGQYTLSSPLDKHPRWFALYTRVIDLMHTPSQDDTNEPINKQVFRRSHSDIIYTSITGTYELYVIFDALTTKSKTLLLVSKLLKHLKKCEDTEFTTTNATF